PWHAESEEGLLDFNSDIAILRKNVRLQSLGDSPQASTLETDELTLNNRTRFITTDQPVKITSPQGEVTAIGMDAYVDEERMILNEHVKGLYATAPPQPPCLPFAGAVCRHRPSPWPEPGPANSRCLGPGGAG